LALIHGHRRWVRGDLENQVFIGHLERNCHDEEAPLARFTK
jgi:hypothetical protein